MSDSTAPDLNELRRMEAEATPGPWRAIPYDGGGWQVDGPTYCTADCAESGRPQEEAELIAAMRNALPHLLRIAEASREQFRSDTIPRALLEQENAQLRAEVERLNSELSYLVTQHCPYEWAQTVKVGYYECNKCHATRRVGLEAED